MDDAEISKLHSFWVTVFGGLFSSSFLFKFIHCSFKGRSDWVRWIFWWREKTCPSLVSSWAGWRNFEMWQGGNSQHGAANLQLKQRDWQMAVLKEGAVSLRSNGKSCTTGDTAQFSSAQKVTQVHKTKPGSKDLPVRTQWAGGGGGGGADINCLYFYSGRPVNFNFSGLFVCLFVCFSWFFPVLFFHLFFFFF